MWDLSSTTRDRTRVPSIGKQILNHWTTSEVPWVPFFKARNIPSVLLCTYCVTRRNIWSPPHFEWWQVWWKVQILSSWLLFPHGIGYVFIVSQPRNAPEPFKYFSFASRHWALSLEGTRESLQRKRFLLPGSGMLLARLLKLAPGFSSTSSWSTGNLPTIQLLPCTVVINKQRQQQPLGRFYIVHPGVNSFLLHPRGWISGKFQRADFQ